jgi:TolB-like protein
VTEPSHAVFLSHASQDAQAAQRICEALRAGGIEVWFDQSELRGGDAWDRSIRRQIKSCALFIPVISKNTHDRDEGYFRLEWKLAVDRSHLMSGNRVFLLPVVIDDTRDDDEQVPDSIRAVQWTHMPRGEAPPAFVERVRRLLAPADPHASAPRQEEPHPLSGAKPPAKASASASWLKRGLPLMGGIAILGAVVYLGVDRPWISKPSVSSVSVAIHAGAAAFSPPPHSIAVLPFMNLSGDKDEEYFSDGVSEELINALSQIDALQVAARTSSFSFKGKNVDIRTIARALGVADILEGSIRRSGNKVRITAELIDAVNGFHLWSREYDRDLRNILALQTEIATSVAAQLQARLLGDESAKIEAGGTQSPQAYDAYLRGRQRFESSDLTDEAGTRAALAWYDRAISLDSNYAAAHAQRARALSSLARFVGRNPKQRQALFRQARAAAERAVALAPTFADGHVALGWHVLLFGYFDFRDAAREIGRAMSLAPGSAYVLRTYGSFQLALGHPDTAIAAVRRAVSLDPENYLYGLDLLDVLDASHRFSEELAEAQRLRTLRPDLHDVSVLEAYAYLGMGHPQKALELCGSQSTPFDIDDRHYCLALVYHALGRRKEAERELETLRALDGDSGAAYYADVYAQWGEPAAALQWLATAERLRDPYLIFLKADWRLDPIRNQPEFKALERRLNIPG